MGKPAWVVSQLAARVACADCALLGPQLNSQELSAMETTEGEWWESCHCGMRWTDSDHCKWCGCEQWESTCTEQWDGVSRDWWSRTA